MHQYFRAVLYALSPKRARWPTNFFFFFFFCFPDMSWSLSNYMYSKGLEKIWTWEDFASKYIHCIFSHLDKGFLDWTDGLINLYVLGQVYNRVNSRCACFLETLQSRWHNLFTYLQHKNLSNLHVVIPMTILKSTFCQINALNHVGTSIFLITNRPSTSLPAKNIYILIKWLHSPLQIANKRHDCAVLM